MKIRKAAGAVLASVTLLATTFTVRAEDLPAIPDRPQAEQFKDVPAPWRDYLIQARAAMRIADPLQRCLAFPDLPGNQWPSGHSAAHCRYHNVKVISLADVEAMLVRGDVAGLERQVGAYLDKHFSGNDFGEDIHRFYEQFEESTPDVDRITSMWLEKAPESAYALNARAYFLRDSAWRARGEKYAQETPRESMRAMSRFVDQAVPLLKQAIKREPRLMPAYSGLLNVAMVDSRADLEDWAVQRARKIDPACVEFARMRMTSLKPRWGGSYEQMLAYANELGTHAARRPQLALHIAEPFGDRGDRLLADDRHDAEAVAVLEVAVKTGASEPHLHDAANAVMFRTDGAANEDWKGVAYLLQEARYQPASAWTYRTIGRRLGSYELEWTLRLLTQAESLEPQDAWGQYLLGVAHSQMRRFAEAERHYLIAEKDEGQRQWSLRDLSVMWLYQADLPPKEAVTRARPYIDRLLQEYPDDRRALIYRIDLSAKAGNGVPDVAMMKEFLRVADVNDPMQKQYAESIRAWFKSAGIR